MFTTPDCDTCVMEDTVIQRDWSQLPPELLEHFAEHVVSISDFIRFRSVCKSWRAAAAPNKLRPQPPLLLHPYYADNPDRNIFCVGTQQVHQFCLPQLVGKKVLDSAYGWMLLIDKISPVSLFNPITLAHIQLPPYPEFVSPAAYGYIFHDPVADKLVVLQPGTYHSRSTMTVWKAGDESWSRLSGDLICRLCYASRNHSITYHKGKFFQLCGDLIFTHDASLPYSDQQVYIGKLGHILDNWKSEYSYFLTTRGHELLLVCHPDPSVGTPDEGILLYKLDCEGQQIKSSKLQSNDYAIMTTRNRYILFCVKNFPQYKENCVYWHVQIDTEEKTDMFTFKEGILISNPKDGTNDLLPCIWEKRGFSFETQLVTVSLQ